MTGRGGRPDTGKGRKRKTTRKKETQTNPKDPIPSSKFNPLETKTKMSTAGESYKLMKLGFVALQMNERIC